MHHLRIQENKQGKLDSKQSESVDGSSSALYDVILKNLKNQLCDSHHKNYEYFYKGALLCQSCFKEQLRKSERVLQRDQMLKYQYFYHLRNIMNYPIILLAQQKTLFQYPIEIIDLLLKSYQPLFSKKSDLSIQKELIHTFINRLKNRIEALCNQLLAYFQREEVNLFHIGDCREQIKHINKMYEQQFLELLGQKYIKGNKDQLQVLLEEYKTKNQNPFHKIYNNLDQVMSYLTQTPIINTIQLAKLYTTITDEQIWEASTIITTNKQATHQDNAELVIMDEDIILQGEYTLQIGEKKLILLRENRQIGKLDISFDSMYHLNRYRLIGVNYDSIQIISYFDNLTIDDIYSIQGCTDILSFKDDIIAISNGSLIKIDLTRKKCIIIEYNVKELRYINKELFSFSYQNIYGQKIQGNSRNFCKE